jgi:hypothetical protein
MIHYANKHGPDAVPDKTIGDALSKYAAKKTLPCAVAFDVAKRLQVEPEVVGRTADLLELRLVKCQLGLFGYGRRKSIVQPLSSVPPAIKKAVHESLESKRLPCKKAWDIANLLKIHKMKVSAACDAMGVRIGPCQLGAF